ncbi:MAG: phage Gp37/Gp68 family protein [Bacteroidota bacterium]
MSKIEWTNKTWNPVTGCTKVSQGCKNCYAERIYERFNGKGTFKNVICHDDRLQQPLRWRNHSLIFVNSMSDLFHEDVPFSFIYEIYLIMQRAHWHTFQILTKRVKRMLQFYSVYAELVNPVPNVWIGVSVEDQQTADERIPLLRSIPAEVKFLSCEPLLGLVDLVNIRGGESDAFNPGDAGVQWVICGGESGHGARPMHPEWARSLRDQCKRARTPFFFKQWGEWSPLGGRTTNGSKYRLAKSATLLGGEKGYTEVYRVGKKKAGRLLDGVMHNEFPNV